MNRFLFALNDTNIQNAVTGCFPNVFKIESHLNVCYCCRFGNYKARLNYIKGFTFAD